MWNAVLTACRANIGFFRKVIAFNGKKQIFVINGKGGKIAAECVSDDFVFFANLCST